MLNISIEKKTVKKIILTTLFEIDRNRGGDKFFKSSSKDI